MAGKAVVVGNIAKAQELAAMQLRGNPVLYAMVSTLTSKLALRTWPDRIRPSHPDQEVSAIDAAME